MTVTTRTIEYTITVTVNGTDHMIRKRTIPTRIALADDGTIDTRKQDQIFKQAFNNFERAITENTPKSVRSYSETDNETEDETDDGTALADGRE